MNASIHRLVLLAAIAGSGLFAPGASQAKESETHEAREVRESREDRDRREVRDREQRDSRERRDASRESGRDRSGSNSGSGSGDHAEEDRSGEDRSGSGSGGNSGRPIRVDVERGIVGGDRQRDEVLLIGPDDAIPAVRRAGYTLLSERRMESLQQTMVRVRVRDGQSVEQLMDSLRQLVPGARVAPNHVFNPSQQRPVAAFPDGYGARSGTATSRLTVVAGIDIGVIDTGADTGNARLRPLVQATRGFATGGYQPRPHGTAVAQLAALPGTTLAIADVFGIDGRNQLVAPAEQIAAALDWMGSQHAKVINISIEGPYNAVLELVVQDVLAHGAAIVAPAGNGGPAAPPAYPAAFAGVVAVTALDERGRIYRRATRGDYVQFAALGSYGLDQNVVETPVALAGTSFAAPVVAAEIMRRWRDEPNAGRETILAAMRAAASDMGAPGHDPIYGWGRIDALRKDSAIQRPSVSASLPP